MPFARHTLEAADAASHAVREVHGVLSGKLRIGTIQTGGTAYRLSEWLGEFPRPYPGLDIFIQQLAGKTVELAALANERFIETLPGWASREQTHAAFAAAGITRRINCEVGEWGMVTDLVRVGLALTLALIRPDSEACTPAAQHFSDFVQRKLALPART